MKNHTYINSAQRLVVEFKEGIHPTSLEDRTCLAGFVAERMYGVGNVPAQVPYHNDGERLQWVMDQHNDWFMNIDDEGTKLTVWHRNPQERHILILGGLEHSLKHMTLVLLPSQLKIPTKLLLDPKDLVENPPLGAPVFVMEDPNLLGLPTDEGRARMEKFAGDRKLEVSLRPCYVHGKLQDVVGYDIAMLVKGRVQDVEEQDITLIDANEQEHKALLLAITLPHKTGYRAAFIIDPEEKESIREYLQRRVNETTAEYPQPMV